MPQEGPIRDPARTRAVDAKLTENGGETVSGSAGAAESGAVDAAGVGGGGGGGGGVGGRSGGGGGGGSGGGGGGGGLTEVPEYSGTDPALRLLGEVWDELPDAVKNRILRLANQSIDTPSS